MGGLIFVLPLVLWPFGFQTFGPIKDFVLAAGGIGIAFVFLIMHLEGREPADALHLRRSALYLPVAVLLLLTVLSVAVAHNRAAAISRLVVLLGGVGLFWVLSQDAGGAGTRRTVSRMLVVSATLVAAYAVGEFLGILPSYRGRQYLLVATLGTPNFVAEFLALAFPAGLAMFLRIRRPTARIVLLFVLAVQYSAILLSGSKGAWGAWVVGTGAGAVTAFVCNRRKLTQGLWIPGLVTLLLLESLTLGRYLATVRVVPLGESAMARMVPGRFEAPPEEWLSFQIRGGMARETLHLIRDHPFLGVGAGNYFTAFQPYVRLPEEVLPPGQLIDHTHNDFLEILAELGPLGLLAFLGILVLGFWRSWRLARSGRWPIEDAAAALSFVVTFSINSLINFGFFEPVSALLFWTTMGLLAAPANGEAAQKQGRLALRPTRWPVRPLSLGLALAYAGILIVAIRPVVADTYVRRAVRAYAQSDLRSADQYLSRALVLTPESFATRFIRLKLLDQQGRLAEAAELAREGLRRFPGAYLLQGALGDVLQGQGDLPAADAAYERALQFYPYLSASVAGLGSVAERRGDSAMALARYEEALRLNSKSAFAWMRIGRLHLRHGEVPGAVKALKTARNLSPEDPVIAMYLGQAHLAAGDRLHGLMELDRARRRDPMNLEILQAWRNGMGSQTGALPAGHPLLMPTGGTR